MSNAVTQRKSEVTKFLNSNEVTNRIVSLFSKDDKKAEKFKATVINIALDKNLANCTVPSILKSALDIAELELPLAKGLGQSYIVKYKADAQPVIGYKGWLALAKRSNVSVVVDTIFKCDEFSISGSGFDKEIVLKPNFDKHEEYNPKWVEENLRGMLVSIKDGNEIKQKFVSFGKLKQIAGVSPSVKKGSYSAYTDWGLEMYQGKAIKYVLSKEPMSELVARAVEVDNHLDIEKIEDNKTNTSLDLNAIAKEDEPIDTDIEIKPLELEVEEPTFKKQLSKAIGSKVKPIFMRNVIGKMTEKECEAYLNDPASLDALIEELSNAN